MSELRDAVEAVGRELESLRADRDSLKVRLAACEAALRATLPFVPEDTIAAHQAVMALSGDPKALREMLVEAAQDGINCVGKHGDLFDTPDEIADRVLKGGGK